MSDSRVPICYRQKRSVLTLGVVSTICFVSAAFGHSIIAILNPDGSFKYPFPTAVVGFLFYSTIASGGIWMILSYLKYRLTISSTQIQQTGVINAHAIDYQEINDAAWHIRPLHGKLQLASPRGDLTIKFEPFTDSDRQNIIWLLHERIPQSIQRNWDEFNVRHVAPNPKREQAQIRVGQFLSLAVLAFAIVFTVAAFVGLGNQYYVYSVLNLAGFTWVRWRKKAQPPDKAA